MKEFATKDQLFKYLKDNKSLLMAEKKAALKCADALSYGSLSTSGITKSGINKAIAEIEAPELDKLKVKIVINTTNLLDSHGDVHIPGLWNKTLKEQKLIYHIQEHCLKFENVISDDVIATAQSMLWSELGESFTGKTEALIFDSVVSEDRNEFMFEQYLKGYVKQHSVGMRYVSLFLCINSMDAYYSGEKDNWDKYITQVANVEQATEQGYFWAVTEAKLVEGSAVVLGSNSATPTLQVNEFVPSDDTQNKDKTAEIFTADEFKKELKQLLKI
jgi:hypothetical protein